MFIKTILNGYRENLVKNQLAAILLACLQSGDADTLAQAANKRLISFDNFTRLHGFTVEEVAFPVTLRLFRDFDTKLLSRSELV